MTRTEMLDAVRQAADRITAVSQALGEQSYLDPGQAAAVFAIREVPDKLRRACARLEWSLTQEKDALDNLEEAAYESLLKVVKENPPPDSLSLDS